VLIVTSTALFFKYITLAIENYKSFATFLNIDALILAGTIDRSVGKSDLLLTMVSLNRSDLTQFWPNKM
jgi:hypothetical protein